MIGVFFAFKKGEQTPYMLTFEGLVVTVTCQTEGDGTTYLTTPLSIDASHNLPTIEEGGDPFQTHIFPAFNETINFEVLDAKTTEVEAPEGYETFIACRSQQSRNRLMFGNNIHLIKETVRIVFLKKL